jgi:zinc transporter, ZIP family
MSFGETVALGALAGFTIYLGLPFGRLRLLSTRTRVGLAMFSVGILAFLFAEIIAHGFAIVEEAVEELGEDEGSFWSALGLTALFGGGFAAGSVGLALLESRFRPRRKPAPPLVGGSTAAMTVDQAEMLGAEQLAQRAHALRLGMTIAAAIGIHNFAEGLAIGVSASTGEIGLATVLIIGFALHNATEGFGIVAPLTGEPTRPSWRFLAVLGVIGGAPTFFGTLIGQAYTSEPLSILFLSLAAGSILFVVIELLSVSRRLGSKTILAWAIFAGLALGFATDFVIEAAGG